MHKYKGETLGALRLILCRFISRVLRVRQNVLYDWKGKVWQMIVESRHPQSNSEDNTPTTEIKQEQTITKADSMIS